MSVPERYPQVNARLEPQGTGGSVAVPCLPRGRGELIAPKAREGYRFATEVGHPRVYHSLTR